MGKLAGFGTELQLYNGATYDTVAGVTNLGGPGLKLDTVDVTTHDQATAWEEVVATVLRTGEIALDIVYDPADGTHDPSTGLLYYLENKSSQLWKIVWPNHPTHTTWEFTAYCSGFSPTGEVAGALKAAITLKITGAPTLV